MPEDASKSAPVDRVAALHELEAEFRYLSEVQAQAKMARVDWLVTLMRDLKEHIWEFWRREYPKETI